MQLKTNKFSLNEGHRKVAKYIGKKRFTSKRDDVKYNDSGYHLYNKDRAHPHQIGAACELIYGEITSQEPDLNFYELGDKTDFNGVEIKGATFSGKDIELKIKVSEYNKKKDTRAYILCRSDEKLTFVEFIGCISRERFDKLKVPKKYRLKREGDKIILKKNAPLNWVVPAKELKKSLVVIKKEGGDFEFIDLAKNT